MGEEKAEPMKSTNLTLHRCNLESPQQVQAICAKMFGTTLRGTAFQSTLNVDPKRVTRILQMRAEGRIIRDIAKEVKISKATIIEILRGAEK